MITQLRNGRGNKTDDDQRHTECDQLSQNIFDGYHYIHHGHIGKLPDDNSCHNSKKEAEWQTFKNILHVNLPSPFNNIPTANEIGRSV